MPTLLEVIQQHLNAPSTDHRLSAIQKCLLRPSTNVNFTKRFQTYDGILYYERPTWGGSTFVEAQLITIQEFNKLHRTTHDHWAGLEL